MSDTTDQIEALLRGIEERTKHSHVCLDRNEASREANPCVCDYAARVRAEQARAVERMLEAAYDSVPWQWQDGGGPFKVPAVLRVDFWAAALRAGEEHQ